jgi:hypothetical protein
VPAEGGRQQPACIGFRPVAARSANHDQRQCGQDINDSALEILPHNNLGSTVETYRFCGIAVPPSARAKSSFIALPNFIETASCFLFPPVIVFNLNA